MKILFLYYHLQDKYSKISDIYSEEKDFKKLRFCSINRKRALK